MRKVLLVFALLAVTLPLRAQSQASSSTGGRQPAAAAAQGNDLGGVGGLGGGRRARVPTGPVPRLPDGTVDLYGAWVGGGSINDLEKDGGLKPGDIDNLMLPWARTLMATRKDPMDPHNFCLPMGVPRTTPFPFRFLSDYTHKAAGHMFILHEGNIHTYRQIFMDGRQHPADLDSTWLGHSIGRWEGDTLVIDTVGFNDKFWFDRRGHPHTEQLHVIERWTRKDLGHMENKVTIDDPGAYSKPFTVTFTATLSPDDELQEYICQENNQYGVAGGNANPYATTP